MTLELYPRDYLTSAERFRARCDAAGARRWTYPLPERRGPANETLAIDVAWFGAPDADRVLLFTLGTHGLEGFCGSAVLEQWLAAHPEGPPRGTALLAVHAVNPWGFAHLSRTTENNVDLNRNFLDFASEQLRPNPIYVALHPSLCPDDWTAETIAAGRAALDAANAAHGKPAVSDALARGQSECADGLNYTGLGPEWSHRTMVELLNRHLPSGRDVTAIDLHTGLGPYGEPYFLCFHAPDSAGYARVAEAYGEGVRSADRSFQGGVRPQYKGLLINALGQLVAHRRFAGLVIEFGTRPHNQVKDSLRLDRWLKFGRANAATDHAALKAQVLEDYCPSDEAWRRNVLSVSNGLLDRAFAL